MGTDTFRALFERSVALAAQTCTYTAAHAASCLPLTMPQARAEGSDMRRRVTAEQCGPEHMRRPAPRLAHPDRLHAARMPAHPVPTTFLDCSRRAGRSSSCRPKNWPTWSVASIIVQARPTANSLRSGWPRAKTRPMGLLRAANSMVRRSPATSWPGATSAQHSETSGASTRLRTRSVFAVAPDDVMEPGNSRRRYTLG